MNKIRVIDLLNKIANEEEVPKRIKYNGICFEYTGLNYYCEDADLFLERTICIEDLNYPVEIIEEDKEIEEIKEIHNNYCLPQLHNDSNITYLAYRTMEHENKLNELIKAVNELKKGK